MKTHKEKWLEAMIKKHGSQEAVTKFMQEAQQKSRLTYKGTGGFYNRELAVRAAKLSAISRRKKVEALHKETSESREEN